MWQRMKEPKEDYPLISDCPSWNSVASKFPLNRGKKDTKTNHFEGSILLNVLEVEDGHEGNISNMMDESRIIKKSTH